MKSTIGFGAFGWSEKSPPPSVTRTVIVLPSCLYHFSTTRVLSFSHGSRLPQSCRIGTPALASGARLSIGCVFDRLGRYGSSGAGLPIGGVFDIRLRMSGFRA